ncbi:MAG: NADH-quinone oxidoreductase subunit N, partial [candidate division Zixibacteria bacterium]|nr:NADH-quinone oxidoreductase subunit N [candidate division Zixibacteria bacterium]
QADYTWLVIVGLLTSVVALYYYANVIKMMYFTKDGSDIKIDIHPAARLVLVLGVIGVIIFGIYPEPVLNLAMESAALFAIP